MAVDLRLESGGLRLAVTDDGRGGVGGERARVTLALPLGGEIAILRRDDP